MFATLHYPLGIFVNIDSNHSRLDLYQGRFRNRLHAFALHFGAKRPLIYHSLYVKGELIERTYPLKSE